MRVTSFPTFNLIVVLSFDPVFFEDLSLNPNHDFLYNKIVIINLNWGFFTKKGKSAGINLKTSFLFFLPPRSSFIVHRILSVGHRRHPPRDPRTREARFVQLDSRHDMDITVGPTLLMMRY